jgi:hypothetical protein
MYNLNLTTGKIKMTAVENMRQDNVLMQLCVIVKNARKLVTGVLWFPCI